MMKEKRILLLGAYSMEVVECGGALLKNLTRQLPLREKRCSLI